MKNSQISRKAMYARVGIFFEEHSATFEGVIPLRTEIDHFKELLVLLDEKDEEQNRSTRQLSAEKQVLRAEWIRETLSMCLAARSWALRHEPSLINIFHSSPRALKRMPEARCLETGREILRHMRIHITSLSSYGITTESIERAENKANQLEARIPGPSKAIKHRKHVTHEISDTISQLDKTLAILDSLISGLFADTEPQLFREYRMMRVTRDHVRRHTGIRMKLMSLATRKPVERGRAVIRELKRTGLTDIDGIAEIIGFKTGIYHIDIYIGDQIVKTIICKIPRGRIVEVEEVV